MVVEFDYHGSTIAVVLSSTLAATETAFSALAPARAPLSTGCDPPVPAPLRSLTQPGPGERVGAVVDLALLGARGAGKTALCHLLIRTLRARAPELGGDEAGQQRQLVAGALGSTEHDPAPRGPRHAVLRLPVVTLLDGLGRAERVTCYARAGMARSIGLTVVSALAVLMALAVWRQAIEPAAIGAAVALLLAGALASWSAARSRWLEIGEIEVVLWDGSGAPEPPEDVAELHAVFESLVRERRRRGPVWRSYGFAPVLVVNPVALGQCDAAAGPDLDAAERLRLSLPVFAALGGDRPRALVAVSRFAAVPAVCRPGTDRRQPAALRTSGTGGRGDALVNRERIRRLCLDAEDGRAGDVHLSHLRYDAADAGVTSGEDGRTEIHWSGRTTELEGEARRALFRFLARSIHPPAVLDDRPHVPNTSARSFPTAQPAHRRSPSANPDVAAPPAARDLPRPAVSPRRG